MEQPLQELTAQAFRVAGNTPSWHMNIRKEFTSKRAASAKPSRPLKGYQLTNRSLRRSRPSLQRIIPGHVVGAWKFSGQAEGMVQQSMADAVRKVFGPVLASPKRILSVRDRTKFVPNNIFAYETICRIGDEPVRILAFLDRDPSSLFSAEDQLKDRGAGVSSEIDETLEAQIAQRSEEFRQRVLESDEMLSAADVAELTGVTRQHVNNQYRRGKLLGLIHPARQKGVRFPRWQFELGIAGEPLRTLLGTMEGSDPWDKWLFFTSKEESLSGLTPIEALTGKATAPPPLEGAIELLREPSTKRLERVISAARGYVSD